MIVQYVRSSIRKTFDIPLILPFDQAREQPAGSILDAEELNSALLKTTLRFLIKIGVPFQILVGVTIIYNVWVVGKSPPINFYIHVIGCILQFGAILYYAKRNPYLGILYFFGLNIILVAVQTLRTHEPMVFPAIIPIFALPSLVLRAGLILKILSIHTLLFFVIGYFDPQLLNHNDWKIILFLTWVIIIGFIAVGVGFRRVVQDYVAAIDAYHAERESYEQAERLRNAEKEAREFVSLYNHEIGGLFTTLSYTLKELRQADREVAAELWETLDEATNEIAFLLGDMERVTREGRAAPLRRERLDVRGLVTQAIANVEVIYPTVRFEAEIVIPTIVGDRTYLLRAIETGIRNAAQAVEREESPFVLISVFPEGGLFVIRIEDTGPGFAPHVLTHVQESLAALATLPLGVSTKEEGSGRGLPLMQRVALLHGGTLALGNGEGGAWVEIRFPAR